MKILKKVSFIIVIGVVLLCSGLLYIRHCEWNPAVAASYATNNAESRSVGLCGLYVRKAIIAGGIPLYLGGDAWSYKYTLPILGFERINKDEKLIIGDIAVFQPIGGRKFGHIAMWNGSISGNEEDFQKSSQAQEKLIAYLSNKGCASDATRLVIRLPGSRTMLPLPEVHPNVPLNVRLG